MRGAAFARGEAIHVCLEVCTKDLSQFAWTTVCMLSLAGALDRACVTASSSNWRRAFPPWTVPALKGILSIWREEG